MSRSKRGGHPGGTKSGDPRPPWVPIDDCVHQADPDHIHARTLVALRDGNDGLGDDELLDPRMVGFVRTGRWDAVEEGKKTLSVALWRRWLVVADNEVGVSLR